MTPLDLARLEDIRVLLESAGYTVERRELAGRTCLLGETPYALVAVVELDEWSDLAENVFDVQAAL